ncbi:bifunctional [glutamate--ammonia ligase]-adenylyl-L-tyrosine phosphorylase/[glutamate--ammonia-ligase] adenylyltransferase [Candidatus Halobeggiatoa sp. HSG11]|nr:bifunctional [glutamate--ammonia ligase]-adenylyl-L-tyrosine phosphorylase/[glutamate--ammonia-ligase] adenylyltransferase [Candidatus Halobeggiatoa sp. HSG11]
MSDLKNLPDLPILLRFEVKNLWQDYTTNATPEQITNLKQQKQVYVSLAKVWACSPFVAKNCVQSPALLDDLIDDLLVAPTDYLITLDDLLLDIKDEAGLMHVLRLFRRREMMRIAWRDITCWASLEETLQSLSNLADALLDTALRWLYNNLTGQLGTPSDANGTPQPLIILAMGKLGGQELNFSSDIDLIFTYPEAGETTGIKWSRSNQEFFIRLGQRLIHVLNSLTPEGFVFRVDMRLRPFGESGPLVTSFAAMENYYQTHARDWERYALVKSRVAAGYKPSGNSLLRSLRPFVYRRYLDFNAFESLRNMKNMIDRETSRKGLNNNIKLGPGGIREIEFTCQVFQLIRGGQQPALQQRNLLETLKQLEIFQILPKDAITRLREAYCFLRLTENHLQAIDDRQTQTLPDDEINQSRLAYSMGFSDWTRFLARLIHHQQQVHSEFEQVFAPESELEPVANGWQTLWDGDLHDDEQAILLLNQAGFKSAQQVLTFLRQLLNSYSIKKLNKRGRERLDTLIPMIIMAAQEHSSPDDAIQRSLKLIESITQRGVYLALLIERPQVLKRLVSLCADSAWIAEQITRYPLLLDELLDSRNLFTPLKPAELDNALQAQLAHQPIDDLEMQMDILRQFKRAYVLHVAATEISGNLTVDIASDYLSSIADTLIRKSLTLAYDYLIQRHGQPTCPNLPGLCVVAYGKAGGMELSYGSDLDVVFLHHDSKQTTDGDRPLDNQVFFVRLAQRIIHIITTNTPAGTLYEVDSRLRPSGSSGMLVTTFSAFENYQKQNAWTWEHQALIRARAVAGNKESIELFEQIRRNTLSTRRDPKKLLREVRKMREKMRSNLDKSDPTKPPFDSGLFDLKQGRGGIADIEFIIQYGVLLLATDYPALLRTTGMLPLIKLLIKYNLFTESVGGKLREAFWVYRTEVHRLTMQNKPAIVKNEKFAEHRQQVIYCWEEIMESYETKS